VVIFVVVNGRGPIAVGAVQNRFGTKGPNWNEKDRQGIGPFHQIHGRVSAFVTSRDGVLLQNLLDGGLHGSNEEEHDCDE